MEILAKKNDYTYIVEIGEEEIAKVFNSYNIRETKYSPLKVGQKINLAEGYIFRNEIKNACQKMIEAAEAFKKAQDTMLSFAGMVIEQDKEKSK